MSDADAFHRYIVVLHRFTLAGFFPGAFFSGQDH
jgi:hypothetical protein